MILSHPETERAINQLLIEASGNDKSAYQFICEFSIYLDQVNDALSGRKASNHNLIALFAATNILYSLPFYTRNAQSLQLPVLALFNELGDALKWRNSPEGWKRQWSDISEMSMINIVIAVANLTVGFTKSQEISISLKELVWASAPKEGKSNG